MKLTAKQKSARGQDCVLRIPACCNFNPETTVLAHVGSGSAKRRDDENAVYACSDCHDAIDRRSRRFLDHNDVIQDKLTKDRRFYIKQALERMK